MGEISVQLGLLEMGTVDDESLVMIVKTHEVVELLVLAVELS